MEARIQALTQANNKLQLDAAVKQDGVELSDEVAGMFAPHLQVKAMDAADRQRIMGRYPKKSKQLPSALCDHNGLAAKAFADNASKKWALTQLPACQREALDVLRLAAMGLHAGENMADSTAKLEFFRQTLRDIAVIACDNAQRMAKTQLDLVFEAAGTKGARALLNFAPTIQGGLQDVDLDLQDDNILQASHVDAMQEIRKYSNSVEQARKKFNGNGNRRGGKGGRGGGRRHYRNGGGGKGGRGNGSWRNNYNRSYSNGYNSSNNNKSPNSNGNNGDKD